MKKLIYTLPLFLLYLQCSAQTKLVAGEFKGRHETVVVKNAMSFNSVDHIFVYLKSNHYINGNPHPKKRPVPMRPKDLQINTEEIKPIVTKVLASKLLQLKQNKEEMNVQFMFNTKGAVIDVYFNLHANTLITVEDIEEIDKLLKNNVKASFTGIDYRNYEVINSNFIPPVVF
ncbi:MAG: hypothetical protein JWQ79_1789 [Mucilaginibacter sp.]|nr:hypothetical protein [Mucilaginibacter sp.]